jgi:hypothetical protein
MAPAFFVSHQPGRAFLKASPLLAFGSLAAFLQPGSVHAEMVMINLAKMSGYNIDEASEH